MRLVTNIDRDTFGGITVSHLKFFDWIVASSRVHVIGIEFLGSRTIREPSVFYPYTRTILSYYVLNVLDFLKKYRWGRNPFLSFFWRALYKKTADIIVRERGEVVLVNGTYWASWILARAAYFLGKPYVVRYAGLMSVETQHRSFFERQIFRSYEAWIAKHAHAIIFPSPLCKEIVERDILRGRDIPSLILPNPVVTPVWRAKNKTRRRSVVLGFVGRLSSVKNFPGFVQLHKSLLQQGFDHEAVAVTSRPPRQSFAPSTISFVPPVSPERLPHFLRTLDVLLVPSHFETFSNVAAEALLQGTSVLVTPRVGIASFLEEAGLSRMIISSFEDTDEVIAALDNLRRHPLTKKEWQRLADILSPDRIHTQLFELLERAAV